MNLAAAQGPQNRSLEPQIDACGPIASQDGPFLSLGLPGRPAASALDMCGVSPTAVVAATLESHALETRRQLLHYDDQHHIRLGGDLEVPILESSSSRPAVDRRRKDEGWSTQLGCLLLGVEVHTTHRTVT